MAALSRTRVAHRPVVTLLSPSTEVTKQLQKGIAEFVGWKPIESNAVECPATGTLLQWIERPRAAVELLAIQEADNPQEALSRLNLQSTTWKSLLGRTIHASDVLLDHTVVLDDPPPSHHTAIEPNTLKEIAYGSESSSPSHLPRIHTGLYRYDSLALRPLPPGVADHAQVPTTLVFYVSALPDLPTIGKTGHRKGQVLLPLPMDVRLCAEAKHSTVFHEAQESLLAGSDAPLQSTRVLGGNAEDPLWNRADCWIEFRNTVWSRFSRRRAGSKPRIAKAPDLPYE